MPFNPHETFGAMSCDAWGALWLARDATNQIVTDEEDDVPEENWTQEDEYRSQIDQQVYCANEAHKAGIIFD